MSLHAICLLYRPKNNNKSLKKPGIKHVAVTNHHRGHSKRPLNNEILLPHSIANAVLYPDIREPIEAISHIEMFVDRPELGIACECADVVLVFLVECIGVASHLNPQIMHHFLGPPRFLQFLKQVKIQLSPLPS